ncbi:hypothetical protein [Candidatus Nanohalovita haloferacivicina]|uniref:hypothetical protein n=1 Tax=Candidatus Nanohalovita haloferacivicina TaxID=2978046 RepID=UPI00325FD5C0|nr:hypothetical protein HBNXNv_0489 [Candidatus Nanohalobia archaeon BNXNv]
MLNIEDSKAGAIVLFIASSMGSVYYLKGLEIESNLALAYSAFIGIIVAAIWLEVSMRFLVKEATAPLDKLLSR